jgi:hypothetical protein
MKALRARMRGIAHFKERAGYLFLIIFSTEADGLN